MTGPSTSFAVLVVASDDPRHRAELAALLPHGAHPTFVTRLHTLDAARAVVVDRTPALEGRATDDLVRWVRNGGRLLLLGPPPRDDEWSELTGVADATALPRAEYVLAPDNGPLTTRVQPEVAVVDAPVSLRRTGATGVVRTSVRYRDIDVMTHRRIGDGSVTVAGLGLQALATPALRTVLRRSLSPPPPPATRPLGVGIVGYGPHGGMGDRHGAAIEGTEGLRLVAVADTSQQRRAAARRAFPSVTAHADTDGLLAHDDVDVVVVATPPVSHFELARRALRAGRHVVVEKPLCLHPDQADELVALAAEHNRVLTVHQNRRWDLDFLAVQRVVTDGRLGQLFNIETFVGGYAHPCRAWHSEEAVSGGAVYDWGAHHLDWAQLLFGGFPASVQTTAHKRVWHDVTNVDQLRVRLLWDDGREAEFVDSTLAAVRRPKFYLQGTEGTLVGHYRPVIDERVDPVAGYVVTEHHHAEAPADLLLARHEAGLGVSETRLALPRPPIHPFHRNLADHLLLGEPLAVTAEQARRTVILLEAAHRSGRTGGPPVAVTP